ncbi:MAG: phosphoglucosamine mutase [Clostridia bacterium]|nr:phosphoglucosamine mutase [Clostridia bacterium]
MTIGEKIYYIRTEQGISQETLAEQLGVSRQSVSKWELGESVPVLDKISALCNYFGISYNDFLSEDAEILPKKTLPTLTPTGIGANKYFGTDGFRGEVNISLTSEQAYKVGRVLGWYYSTGATLGKRAKVVIGKDTRRSSYMLEYSIIAGLCASGADVYMLHVTTTPGVSYITRCDDFDLGIMITASHNPYYDNGIKLLSSEGEKLDDGVISVVESYLDGRLSELGIEGEDIPFATGEKIGRITDFTAGRHRYIGYLISLVSHSQKSLRIGIDCANGASWSIAPAVFNALGAEIYTVGCEPDGVNINRGVGSTHIDNLISLVKKNRLDVGFAFDGDADRCIAVDASGGVVDGDKILYILAKRLKERGALEGDAVALTVMSNAGLLAALKAEGIGYDITPVGDRFVYERMLEKGYALGGEQSGHVIMKKYATTGDGILTALMITEEMLSRKSSLKSLAADVTIFPSLLKNVTVTDRDAVMADGEVQATVNAVKERLGSHGKVLLRKSGTEPLIRILVESESEEECSQCLKEIIGVIKKRGYICD